MFKTHNGQFITFTTVIIIKIIAIKLLCVLFELLSALQDAENESRSAAGHDGFGWLACFSVSLFCMCICKQVFLSLCQVILEH